MKATFLKNSASQPLPSLVASVASSSVREVWKWGSDNMMPAALSSISRSSAIHRRIVIDKADYIAGRGFKCDDSRVSDFVACCNSSGHSLRLVVQRVALDKCLFGNAIIEIAIGDGQIAMWHQDISRARVAKDKNHVVLHHDWSSYKESESRVLPIYPRFEKHSDGTTRTAILYKDYEPMFENYGVPKYIAALGALAISHKTDRWNVARVDNSFSLSGVMVLDGSTATEDEAENLALEAQRRFESSPGQVMFMVKNSADGDNSKFVPITTTNDGDWKSLHQQATEDILIAHSWFRTLSGMEYSSGFSAERVQNEYNIALSTIIKSEQQDIIEPIRNIFTAHLGWDASSLSFVNTPPFDSKQSYLRIWEARKIDGLDYDPKSTEQNQFLSQI